MQHQHVLNKPKRWRPQRWNCNQKNCARQSILGYDLKVTWPSPEIDNRSFEVGDSALFAFAMHYATFQLSPTEKMIAEDIQRMTKIPTIIIALIHEAENQYYFDTTMYWHAQRGYDGQRPGFRSLDVHDLLLDFDIPYCNLAASQPEKMYVKTYEAIDSFSNEALPADKKASIKKRILLGAQSMRMKLIKKLNAFIFIPPYCLLFLLNRRIGPTIFRAIIPLLKNQGIDLVGSNDENEWGQYSELVSDEKQWNEYYKPHQEMLAQSFGSVGLARSINEPDNAICQKLLQELKRLSNAGATPMSELQIRTTTQMRATRSSTRGARKEVQYEYPTLHLALSKAFSLLPSNTRLAEQGHGMGRHKFLPGRSIAFDDASISHAFEGYDSKDKIREEVREEHAVISGNVPSSNSINIYKKKESCTHLTELIQEKCQTYRYIRKHVLDDAQSVKGMDELGARFLDDDLEKLKIEALKKAKNRKKKKSKTRETVIAEAASVLLEIDNLDEALPLEEQRRRENLLLLSTRGFWDSLQVARGDFFAQVEAVLPKFWKSLGDTKPTKKNDMIKKLKPFLEKVKEISQLEKEQTAICMFDETLNLSNMDQWSRLEVYIEASKCSKIKKKQEQEKALGNIFDSCGSKISSDYTYDIVNEYISQQADDNDEDEENDEDLL